MDEPRRQKKKSWDLAPDSHSTCSNAANQRKRGLNRFSLRRLFYSSPLVMRRLNRAVPGSSKPKQGDRSGNLSRDVEKGEISKTGTNIVGGAQSVKRVASKNSLGTSAPGKSSKTEECPLCLTQLPVEYFPDLCTCPHKSCYNCFQQYLRIEISESRVYLCCPECAEPMHPNDIRMILNDKTQYEKYEDFTLRRALAIDPDTRWCPAPDCGFAVIASGCASCPKIRCERPGCDSYFCYHCKAEWHPNQTCNAARAQRSLNVRSSSVSFSQDSQHKDVIKPCPRCQVLIGKMDDGSCNHMTCAVCAAEFCWLCMKEISDLHYLSPSGCTFWGKKPWSRKKKILWQLGTLVGAPVGIGLVAGIAIPAMIIGIPVWVGRKLYSRYENENKHKRNLVIAGGVTASVLISPILAGIAVSVGVPILLFYVYGVVPVSLCRSGGCGVSTSGAGVRFDFDDENEMSARNTDAVSMDTVSHRGVNPSIGEASLSLGSGSQLERLGRENDRESVSNVALAGASIAGSIASSGVTAVHKLEVQVDVSSTQRFSMSSETASAATSLSEKSVSASFADDGAASVRALAGSVLNFRVGSAHLDSTSVASFKPGESLGLADNASQRSEDTGPASLSSLEELTSGLLRRVTGGRRRLEKQGSENGTPAEDSISERVRFDNHSGSETRDGTSKSVKGSCKASSSKSGNSSSSESAAEGEEQEDSSSSNLAQCQVKVHEAVKDELSNFRQLWKKDINDCHNKNQVTELSAPVDEENNQEEEVTQRAEKWFLEGVENEKNGRLHEAIRFYKKAVQLVPDIEFKLCNSHKQQDPTQNNYQEVVEEYVNNKMKVTENEDKKRDEEDEDDDGVDLMTKLQCFISKSKSICTPVTEPKMTHISSLPMEIILYILRWVVSHDLDMRSLEMCSMVCRGFYVCSKDPEIWRLACLKVWGINCGSLKNYDSWRTMFLTRPRLNFNGYYISRTTYIRHGENSFQDQFYRPWHLVEYYRYFRFFPEGIVYMLTTPDQPSRVTYILKGRDNKHPSILSGHYRLQNDRVFIVLHREDFANNMFRKRKNNLPPDLIEQTYHIVSVSPFHELQVTSRKHKINHCLVWKRYCVTSLRGNTETKTNFEVMSNKFPSFWFSRVKSYTLESEKPLI